MQLTDCVPFCAPFLADAAAQDGSGWIAAAFILLGAALAMGIAELFVPTAGVLAVVTGCCAVASVACFFMHGPLWGLASLLAYSAGAPFALVFGFKLWTKTPIARRMVLGENDGDSAAVAPTIRGDAPSVGEDGFAETALRPVGWVRIGDRRVEATAELGMIDAGTAVTVTSTREGRVSVRARG